MKCMKCGDQNPEWLDHHQRMVVQGEEGHDAHLEVFATCGSCDHVQMVS